jgi:hypothetical protein
LSVHIDHRLVPTNYLSEEAHIALPVATIARIYSAAEHMHRVLETLALMFCESVEFRRFFSAYSSISNLIASGQVYQPHAPVCRLDGIIDTHGRYHIIEVNAASPAGIVRYGLALKEWVERSKFNGTLQNTVQSMQRMMGEPFSAARHVISCYKSQYGEYPSRVSLLHYKGRVVNEMSALRAAFRHYGVAADIEDLASCVGLRGALNGPRGKTVTLAYVKFRPSEVYRSAEGLAYLKAASSGRLCTVSSLIAQSVLHDKATIAWLSDPNRNTALPRDLLEGVRSFLPWTRIITERTTALPDGTRGNLISYCMVSKDELVLKPCNRSRGEGVVIGKLVSKGEWREAMMNAIALGSYVVQSYITSGLSVTIDGTVMRAGVDVFLFGGKAVGTWARASGSGLLNLHAGGVILAVVPQ